MAESPGVPFLSFLFLSLRISARLWMPRAEGSETSDLWLVISDWWSVIREKSWGMMVESWWTEAGRKARRKNGFRWRCRISKANQETKVARLLVVPQGDLLGTAGALTFTSTFLVWLPPPTNWPPKKKIAAATMIRKITNMATTAALLPPPLSSAINHPPLRDYDSLFVGDMTVFGDEWSEISE